MNAQQMRKIMSWIADAVAEIPIRGVNLVQQQEIALAGSKLYHEVKTHLEGLNVPIESDKDHDPHNAQYVTDHVRFNMALEFKCFLRKEVTESGGTIVWNNAVSRWFNFKEQGGAS